MNILSNNKIELTCDDYKLEYVMSIYDVNGHYIDDVVLTREEVKELYEALDSVKNTF